MTRLKSVTNSEGYSIPEIVDISSDDFEFIAGRGQIITIRGVGFGDGRNGGYLSFSNADDGGRGGFLIDDKDDYDYQVNSDNSESWTDTEIKFRLPTYIYQNNINDKTTNIGSGLIRVTNGYYASSAPFSFTISHAYI
jgi:hypothetical protein